MQSVVEGCAILGTIGGLIMLKIWMNRGAQVPSCLRPQKRLPNERVQLVPPTHAVSHISYILDGCGGQTLQ
jgi:hypothetical protein